MSNETDDERPRTAPDSFAVQVRGWGEEASARQLENNVFWCVQELSRSIELSGLDGVTIAADYHQALAELDRGYETNYVLTASNDIAIGVAMTPSVIRDGKLKSHIVWNGHFACGLLDVQHEHFRTALHLLAHECAHVEITAAFERCFPGVLLRTRHDDAHQSFRWDIIQACWDEYAATRISAGFGEDPTDGYEETFISVLGSARQTVDDAIRAYRNHGDVDEIMIAAYTEYGRLMKYAAYHLGNLDGLGIAISDRPATREPLEGHWFEIYLNSLHTAFRELWSEFGKWESKAPFEAIGDIADEIVQEGGVIVRHLPAGGLYVDVPFTAENLRELLVSVDENG